LSMRFRIKQVGRYIFRTALPLQCWRMIMNSSPSHPPLETIDALTSKLHG
jgi:hypothetical protein